MKKMMWMVAGVFLMVFLPKEKADAQIIDAINAAIVKAIMVVDLKVQQVQAQTIWLQNAEAQLENKMALGNLSDISGWVGKEKDLYSSYYNELKTVKQVISDYDEVKRIVQQQVQLVGEYKSAYALFKQDKNFTPNELTYMGQVYDGILQESIRNLDEVMLAINSLQTQMTDAQRLALIHSASGKMQTNLNDLRQFNNGNVQLSLQRAQQQDNANAVRQLYGLPQN